MGRVFGTDIILDGGASIAGLRPENLTVAPVSPFAGQIYFNTIDKKTYVWNSTAWIDLSQVVTGAIALKGNITNANTNPAFPASPIQGDSYFVTTNAGTIGGVAVGVGDQLIYDGSAWFVIEANVQDASTTMKGVVRFGTQAEVNAGLANVAVAADKLPTYIATLGFAKKAVANVGALAANTDVVVTHNLGLANFADLVVEVTADSTRKVDIDVAFTSANTITIRSLASYSGVRVICIA
jgi:hypothetical protein